MPFFKTKDPSIPPGQHVTDGFPVLHVGDVPHIDPKTYALSFTGLVDNPYSITYDELRALPSTDWRGDIHCVTRWSKKETYWRGTLFRTLLERAEPQPGATHAIQYADNDYTTNLPLAAMLGDDVLVAWEYDGRPIEPIHGGPVRMFVPQKYFWKSAKWLHRIDITDHDEHGFWEKRGYNNNADPWKEERYSDLPSWMG
jgi:DMSO/TMAO reductase YedYZ molybdopterin-dependent catalytic subunit